MNLYKIELNGLGTHYVVATDPTSACQIIRKEYDERGYGFELARAMRTISVIAAQINYNGYTARLWLGEKV